LHARHRNRRDASCRAPVGLSILSRRERFDALLLRKSDLSKSNTYYHEIHPMKATQVDAGLAEAAAAAAAKKKPPPTPAPATAPPAPPAAPA
jgi:NADH-quinone oxidoreductase subunit I